MQTHEPGSPACKYANSNDSLQTGNLFSFKMYACNSHELISCSSFETTQDNEERGQKQGVRYRASKNSGPDQQRLQGGRTQKRNPKIANV
jgi:hypothetical protein